MIHPTSEQALAEALSSASGPLVIKGGGTRRFGTLQGEVLTTSGLSGVELYDPGALTIVAKAGTSLAEIEGVLAAENQRLAFEPPDLRGLLGREGDSTIGGVVAANASGPRRIQGGACRDFLLGVRFVDGQGRVLKNGGRVMKNVTGYDLVKLMAGSHGSLGVLSEVSLKVLPLPETTGVLQMTGLTPEAAVKAMSRALGSPFDVTGAAHATRSATGEPLTLIRLEGFADSVAYRAESLRNRLAAFGDVEIDTDPARSKALWAQVRDVAMHVGTEGDVWRISVTPSDGPAVAARLPDCEIQFDWGGGLLWVRVPFGMDVRASLEGINGHATRCSGDSLAPVFHPEPPALATLSQGLRQRFDPRGILNPGLMG